MFAQIYALTPSHLMTRGYNRKQEMDSSNQSQNKTVARYPKKVPQLTSFNLLAHRSDHSSPSALILWP